MSSEVPLYSCMAIIPKKHVLAPTQRGMSWHIDAQGLDVHRPANEASYFRMPTGKGWDTKRAIRAHKPVALMLRHR